MRRRGHRCVRSFVAQFHVQTGERGITAYGHCSKCGEKLRCFYKLCSFILSRWEDGNEFADATLKVYDKKQDAIEEEKEEENKT